MIRLFSPAARSCNWFERAEQRTKTSPVSVQDAACVLRADPLKRYIHPAGLPSCSCKGRTIRHAYDAHTINLNRE